MRSAPLKDVTVTGGTGYLGQPLLAALAARGHRVRALCRPQSLARLPSGVVGIAGDALAQGDVRRALAPGSTLVHLVGTPRPNPWKGEAFRRVDLASIRASVAAAAEVPIAQIVYVSVAHPAPVMRDYIAVRCAGEAMIADAHLTATLLRPWYILGPGHRWPLLIRPLVWLAERFPPTRDTAQRLGFVTLSQMIDALVLAVEEPPPPGERRIVDVAAIRTATLG